MIIYRQKEFASTKESRKKSKEMNKKDKSRENLEKAQLGTAVGGAAAIFGGNKLKKAAEKIEEIVKKENPMDMEKVNKMQKLGKTAKTLHKTAPYLIAASAGLGAVKIARDIKKKKKKEIVLDSKPPKKMKGKESRSDLLKLNK